ncbi:site-specific integrase [Cytobacillus sp. Hm23]
MKVVQPIRDAEQIEAMKLALLKQNKRNYFLFTMGINTGLRISDLLSLKVKDVKNHSHLVITEQKTKKSKRFKLNKELQKQINEYTTNMKDDDYLFKSLRGSNHIKRSQAWKILNEAAKEVGVSECGCHSTRKTFGYFFYKKYKDVALLQEIFNHSHPSVTLRYIGISQDLVDEAVDNFSL